MRLAFKPRAVSRIGEVIYQMIFITDVWRRHLDDFLEAE